MKKQLPFVLLSAALVALTATAQAAVWTGTRWDFSGGTALTYKLYDQNAPSGWKDAVREAIQEWDDLICTEANFVEVTDCTKTGDIYIGWPWGKDDKEPLPVSKPGYMPTHDTWAENNNALGLAWPGPPPFEVDLNPHHTWRTDLTKPGGGAAYDLAYIAKHEWGHVLGLDDTYVGSDQWRLMYGYANPGERKIVTYPDVGRDLKALGYDVHLQKPEPATDEYDISWDGTQWSETGNYAGLYDDPVWKGDNHIVRISNVELEDYFKTVWLMAEYEEAQTTDPNITIATSSGKAPTRITTDWSDDKKTLLMSFWLPDQPEWEEINFNTDGFYTMNGLNSWDVATYCAYVIPEPTTFVIWAALGGLVLVSSVIRSVKGRQ